MMTPKKSLDSLKISEESTNVQDAVAQKKMDATSLFKSDALVLNLKWNLRDQIINNLSRFSSIISGAFIDHVESEITYSTNNEIIWKLTRLPFELNDKNYKDHIGLIDRSVFFDSEKNDGKDLYFQIDWITRFNLIDHLIKNSNFSIYEDPELADVREYLLKENNKLIKILLDLPSKQIGEYTAYNYPFRFKGKFFKLNLQETDLISNFLNLI